MSKHAEVEAGDEIEVTTARLKKVKGIKKAAPKEAKKPANGKPRTKVMDPTKLDQFGFRLGTKTAKAAAMYASRKGATLNEVKEACESSQFNLLTKVRAKGFKVERTPITGESGKKVTKYHIVVS